MPQPRSLRLAVALLVLAVPATANAGLTLSTPVGYSTGSGSNPLGLVSGDLNGDGTLDLVSADNGTGSATVLLGNPDGTFKPGTDYPSAAPQLAAPGDLALGRFLGSGKLDLAVANLTTPNNVNFLPGIGTGAFGPIAAAKLTPAGYPQQGVVAGALTTDGRSDVIIPDYAGSRIDVFLSNGNGTFTTEPTLATPGNVPNGAAIADLNGDGFPDIIAGGTGGLSIFFGKGNGTFGALKSELPSVDVAHLELGDFNGDGRLDIAYVDQSNRLGVMLGDGHGTFAAATTTQTVLADTQFMTVADLDGDGRLDVITTSFTGSALTFYRGNGDGTLAAGQATTVQSPRQVVVGDFNGDGNPDVALAEGQHNQVLVYLSKPPTAGLSSGTVAFPSVNLGTAATMQLTLTNTSAATLPYLHPPAASLTGTDPGDFAVTGCTAPVPPGGNCALTITFRPTTSGTRSATLRLADNAQGGAQTAALSGTAPIPPPTVSITAPARGAAYPVGARIIARFACADAGGPGIAACTGSTAGGTALDTRSPGARTFHVTARALDGQQTNSVVDYRVVASSVAVTALRQSHRTWREGVRRRRSQAPTGTTFSFRLSAAATVRLAFTEVTTGRLTGHRCLPAGRLAHGRACALTITVGSLTVGGRAGANRLSFDGKISRRVTLRPGSYAVIVTPTAHASGRAPRLSFRIVA